MSVFDISFTPHSINDCRAIFIHKDLAQFVVPQYFIAACVKSFWLHDISKENNIEPVSTQGYKLNSHIQF